MSRRAFSLVEMSAVVAILIAIAAVTIPRFVALERGQASRDFQSALLDVAADARIIAIESARTVQVTYRDDRRAIVVESIDPENFEPREESAIALTPDSAASAFTVNGLFATGADWLIEFYPDGTGNNAGLEIDEGGRVYSIRYSGNDGSSMKIEGRLEELADEEWQAGEIETRI